MLLLYYTVAGDPTISNNNPSLSTGGFISESQVPNDIMSVLFSEISLYNLQSENDFDYICIGLKNTGSKIQRNIKLYFDTPENEWDSEIKIGLTIPNEDGEVYRSPNIYAKPIGVNFIEAIGEENALTIDELIQDDWVALWISRKILKDKLRKQNSERDVMLRYLAERKQTALDDLYPTNDFFPSDQYLSNLGVTAQDLENIKQLETLETLTFNIVSENYTP